ncbi:MAG: trimethylamine methyltransferase family protein [Candidatus Thermoplasmatota archaeon]|nr:trimethylamine methyltransferase family protein [Candidatus Thermoplasmatota archaeon]
MKLEILTEDEIARIDKTSIDILTKTGVSIFERQSRDMLRREGAQVDDASARVRMHERIEDTHRNSSPPF